MLSSHPPEPDPQLRRILGPVDATCVVIGAIIGVGIFFTPSQVARLAGSADMALAAWAMGGLIALAGALTFAALGSVYHGPGAQYDVLRDAYGPLIAFLFVFCNATAIQAGATAIIAVICAQNLAIALGADQPNAIALSTSAAAMIFGLTAANVFGVRWGSRVQNATVVAKIAVLFIVVLLAATSRTEPAPLALTTVATEPVKTGFFQTLGILFAAIVPSFFAFGGWQQALWMAGEVRNPRRNLPMAIIVGVSLVVLVYLAANWAYLKLLGYSGVAHSEALAADAVGTVWPNHGRRLLAGGIAVSAFGVLNAQLLSGPRLIYRMASDGRFFQAFATVSARFGTPVAAIGLLGILATILLVAAGQDTVDKLLTGVVFIDGVFFALTGLALVVLRRSQPSAHGFPTWVGYPVVPLLFVLGELGILLGAYRSPTTRQAAFIGLAWIVAAMIVYFLKFRR